MQPHAYPAILIAGPPHSGKSVLAYLLTEALRRRGVAHYLLRAVPDGEGNWYMEGEQGLARVLRSGHKTGYSDEFVEHMREVIDGRRLPLLVDIGGKPQGEQYSILRACSHVIQLYRTQDELDSWRADLASFNLSEIAVLHSRQAAIEKLTQTQPQLQGIISGLERTRSQRSTGATFNTLVELLAELCPFDELDLEHSHARQAPYPLLSERAMAAAAGIRPRQDFIYWEPAVLGKLGRLIPPDLPAALYGRGPVWLAAFVAAHTCRAPLALFDLRHGWMELPPVQTQPTEQLEAATSTWGQEATWVSFRLPTGLVAPEDLHAPQVPAASGVILSGKLPRWAFASLARNYSLQHPWLGIDDPNMGRIVIIHSKAPSIEAGDTLDRDRER
jgi:CRISPR-associated protein Csx3